MLLVYAYGLTQEELAARLATPLGTVRAGSGRSLERLKSVSTDELTAIQAADILAGEYVMATLRAVPAHASSG